MDQQYMDTHMEKGMAYITVSDDIRSSNFKMLRRGLTSNSASCLKKWLVLIKYKIIQKKK